MIARGELLLRYDGGLEISSAGNVVASGPHYAGLEDFAGCLVHEMTHLATRIVHGSDVVPFEKGSNRELPTLIWTSGGRSRRSNQRARAV